MERVPKLRFKEFTRGWEEKSLEDIAKIGRGKSKHRPRNDKILFGGKYPFIQTGDIRSANLFLKNYTQTYSEFGLSQSKLWKKGTLCITIAANIAETCILGIDACFPDSVIGVECYDNISSTIFLKNYFDFLKKEFEKKAEGLAQDNLNLEKLLSIKLNIPSFKEQEKIGEFLSSVDSKIELQEKELELWKKYKKGIMQKTFSQKLRFKDENGMEYPDWEEKTLGEIGEFKNGINKSKDDFGFGFPFVNLLDIFSKTILKFKNFELINATTKELEEYNLLKGDVLFVRSSVKPEGVGLTTVISEDFKNIVYSGFLIRFREKISTFDINFKRYCFHQEKFRNQVLQKSSTSANTNINQESLNSLVINIPSLPEQEKIADYLSGIDDKIEVLEKKVGDMKEFKKALLQQMFI